MCRSTSLALVWAGLALLAASAVTADDLADRVGTLELSQELDSRGQLGGMTVDALGFLYVANFRDAVWKISPDGEVETLTRSLYGASGNAVDSRGDLFQANFQGQTIDRISRTGEVTRFVDHGLQGPVGIAIDDDDNLYVCNCSGNYLSKVTPAGEIHTFAEGDLFGCPNGITFGPDGLLYVTNFNHRNLLRVSPDSGEVSEFANVPGGAGNTHLTFSRGFFYVTKLIGNLVVKVSLDGEVFPLAGSGQRGHSDGDALDATFASPNAIAVSPLGDRLYVNSVVGEYQGAQPSTISVRTIDLVTLTKVLSEALEKEGVAGWEAAYARYRADPVRGRENTVAEMIAYGYTFLSKRQMAEGFALFELNAKGNPDAAAAQYHLGEAYRYAGRTDQAVAQYRRTLQLDPDHSLAASKLTQLGES